MERGAAFQFEREGRRRRLPRQSAEYLQNATQTQPVYETSARYYNDDVEDGGGGRYQQAGPRRESPLQSLFSLGALLGLLFMGSKHGFSNLPRTLVESSLELVGAVVPGASTFIEPRMGKGDGDGGDNDEEEVSRPDFVYARPYVTSSYYLSTKSIKTLEAMEEIQVKRNLKRQAEEEAGEGTGDGEIKTRLAIVRPFCEFDAEALPTTFTCWNSLPPCKAAAADMGMDDDDDYDDEYEVGPDGEPIATKNATRSLYDDIGDRHLFDLVGSDAMKHAKADVFLFYSQTFSENDVSIKAVDEIMDEFFSPGGWSQCFGNIYAIEANIPQELDLYIPSAQEELYNWVNGPNRQFEAAVRIIQSGEWGDYDGFYLMEGDSVPIKTHWLDVLLSEIEKYRPFAILGDRYSGDKWDVFYEKIPISLLHHTNGNGIYNTSHPLLERLVGQLEVEAPCPYNSIPYDYRMSQMWVEGTLGIVPELAPKIMLNEEGENITLSDNLAQFKKWADIWEKEDPFKYTPAIHNYAATNLIPRHMGPEYVIHGAKLYSPWDPTKTSVTLVVSEWFYDRSVHLIKNLDEKDHPFSEVVVMVPPVAGAHDDYEEMTGVPVRTQHRGAPDFMDLCEADVKTDWFMITNSYHSVATHVDLMFTPGTFKPVIPFTPATYPFCFKYPYCKETVNLAQRIHPGADKVVLDMDMLYNTKERNAFCKEWREENGEEGEDLYKHQQRRLMFRKKIIGPPGPTGTSYFAFLAREKKDGMYKMTDRSLYGARPPFIKTFFKEEKLDGMSEEERAKRVGMTLMDNTTDCTCGAFESEEDCLQSGVGCLWRPLFESCYPPELIDGSEPICPSTEAPTMAPTVSLPEEDTQSPTSDGDDDATAESDAPPETDPWYTSMFKSREHDASTTESNSTKDATLMGDDDAVLPEDPARKLEVANEEDSLYETDLGADERMGSDGRRKLEADSLDSYYGDSGAEELPLPMKRCDPWDPSIVPRHPTASNTWWNGASLDPESRSFSAMATSRPRKLHGSFLQYQQDQRLSGIVGSASPMKDSWVTSSVPINTPKYSLHQDGRRTANRFDLEMAEGDRKTFVNYGDGEDYRPLRVTFAADHLLDFKSHRKTSNEKGRRPERVTAATIAKVETLTGDVLPAVSEIWTGALSIVPPVDNIFPLSLGGSEQDTCGEAKIPSQHLKDGIPNTDTIVYVTIDGPRCADNQHSRSLVSHAAVCSFDQNLRPLSANINVCLDNINVSFGEVGEEENLRLTSSLTIEVGKILGMSPSLFRHYRNSETGQPYGSTERKVTCVDGTEQTLLVPNMLQSSADLDEDAVDDAPYFLVATPTVRQVTRNHFDCQRLLGARLSQEHSSSCFGDSFDPRYHFDEDFAQMGGSADAAFSLSPLTLALLADSGWYRANFEHSTVPLFGRGAGCGFVEGDCVGESKSVVPEYSRGFFCNDVADESLGSMLHPEPSECDYTHNYKADCQRGEESESDDVCPMRLANVKLCSDGASSPSLAGEKYSTNSRCFETDKPSSVCLESYCNSIDGKIDIVVSEKVYQCDYEGQALDLGEFTVQCPRLAVICPHLVCPANCSGKGFCDYCREIPQCICNDPTDKSPGCFGSSSSPEENGNANDIEETVVASIGAEDDEEL
ncbi:hypothetical protein ACHAXT_006100 [Thalassiosira profunda]